MRNYRLLIVYFTNTEKLQSIYNWQYKNIQKLNKYNVKIIFIKSETDKIKLYGYDETQKWNQNNFNNLQNIFKIIDTMPMSKYDKNKKINILYEMCGIPESHITQHCFQDNTHLTCCMLGNEARKYAEQSGNPIGSASEQAFYEYYGFFPSPNTLTSWCTCIGSQVCSFYSKKFDDGTHIKFIHNGKIIISSNEKKYLKYKHSTPGIPIHFS
jgi:hypothetical protein